MEHLIEKLRQKKRGLDTQRGKKRGVENDRECINIPTSPPDEILPDITLKSSPNEMERSPPNIISLDGPLIKENRNLSDYFIHRLHTLKEITTNNSTLYISKLPENSIISQKLTVLISDITLYDQCMNLLLLDHTGSIQAIVSSPEKSDSIFSLRPGDVINITNCIKTDTLLYITSTAISPYV